MAEHEIKINLNIQGDQPDKSQGHQGFKSQSDNSLFTSAIMGAAGYAAFGEHPPQAGPPGPPGARGAVGAAGSPGAAGKAGPSPQRIIIREKAIQERQGPKAPVDRGFKVAEENADITSRNLQKKQDDDEYISSGRVVVGPGPEDILNRFKPKTEFPVLRPGIPRDRFLEEAIDKESLQRDLERSQEKISSEFTVTGGAPVGIKSLGKAGALLKKGVRGTVSATAEALTRGQEFISKTFKSVARKPDAAAKRLVKGAVGATIYATAINKALTIAPAMLEGLLTTGQDDDSWGVIDGATKMITDTLTELVTFVTSQFSAVSEMIAMASARSKLGIGEVTALDYAQAQQISQQQQAAKRRVDGDITRQVIRDFIRQTKE